MRKGVKDVAALAGVSIGTVSNVLNRPDVVAAPTRERVEAAIDRLGFVRNESARQLRAGRSRTIAVVVMDITNPFFSDLVVGAEDAADAEGVLVVVSNSGEDAVRERRNLSVLEEQRVLGVLLSPVGDDADALAALRRRGTPVVLVDRHASSSGQCSVSVDDAMGGRLAGEHLRESGHRRVVFIAGATSVTQVRHRLDGFLAGMGDAEVSVLEGSGMSVGARVEGLSQVLGGPGRRRPTALFCANDLLALGALQECTRIGLRVPDDVAIVGYDDIAFAASAAVPLSSVRQPRADLGRKAVELLLSEVSGAEHHHERTVLEPELVVRRSSSVRRRTQSWRGADGTAG